MFGWIILQRVIRMSLPKIFCKASSRAPSARRFFHPFFSFCAPCQDWWCSQLTSIVVLDASYHLPPGYRKAASQSASFAEVIMLGGYFLGLVGWSPENSPGVLAGTGCWGGGGFGGNFDWFIGSIMSNPPKKIGKWRVIISYHHRIVDIWPTSILLRG
jgi:hypothetical protein